DESDHCYDGDHRQTHNKQRLTFLAVLKKSFEHAAPPNFLELWALRVVSGVFVVLRPATASAFRSSNDEIRRRISSACRRGMSGPVLLSTSDVKRTLKSRSRSNRRIQRLLPELVLAQVS